MFCIRFSQCCWLLFMARGECRSTG